MNDKVSHRRVRTQPLTTVLIRASSAELITDIERLAEVAGVDTAVISPSAEDPPAILSGVDLLDRVEEVAVFHVSSSFTCEVSGLFLLPRL